jgi:hypothetical protein
MPGGEPGLGACTGWRPMKGRGAKSGRTSGRDCCLKPASWVLFLTSHGVNFGQDRSDGASVTRCLRPVHKPGGSVLDSYSAWQRRTIIQCTRLHLRHAHSVECRRIGRMFGERCRHVSVTAPPGSQPGGFQLSWIASPRVPPVGQRGGRLIPERHPPKAGRETDHFNSLPMDHYTR